MLSSGIRTPDGTIHAAKIRDGYIVAACDAWLPKWTEMRTRDVELTCEDCKAAVLEAQLHKHAGNAHTRAVEEFLDATAELHAKNWRRAQDADRITFRSVRRAPR